MITELTDLPDGVIGFEAGGTLAAEDYRDVLLPAIERAADSGDLRVLIVVNELDGVSPGAMWEDLKMGLQHGRDWKRIALVTDVEWMRHMAAWFGWLTPGEMRHFPLAERADALTWLAG